MRTIQISVREVVRSAVHSTARFTGRSGLTVAAAAALPLTLAAPAFAGGTGLSGITVSAAGTTVQVSTVACATGGTASLMSSGQVFTQGRQITLAGGTMIQSASWPGVGAGTYTVTVICANGTAVGTRSVTVGAAPTTAPTTAPAISATTTPAQGVRGGLGGSTQDYGTLTKVGGGALVVAGVGGTVWYLRRRARHQRY
ncbi:hypothetical protein ACFVT5_15810 [Streptomyces sp. NPDC058001]|uniref:hypothetical protein n=1 Tax=Streptomyces sp. NPDC058001 TaxID=3346300 RepID=UPI0036F09C7B